MRRARRRVTIEGLYYAHGLLCASYPTTMLAVVFMVVVVCSLPFFVTPSGDLNTPKPWRSPWLNYRVPAGKGGGALGEGMEWIVNNSTQFSDRVPSWFRGLPVMLAQQLYIDVQINCSSHPSFCQKSHFTSSKTAAAYILNTLKDKTQSCYPVLHPAAVSLTSELDPAHPPGILSPLLDSVLPRWDSDHQVMGFQTTKELLYGGFWQKEHSSTPPPSHPSPPSPHPKSHTFSITLLLDASVSRFSSLTHCVEAIRGVWPLKEKAPLLDARADFIKHFYYEPEWSFVEFLPLLSVYFIVFLYISFSVGKIDLVKSKVGLGIAAIVTLICSLTMSLGICTFFGLSISLSSSEVYPFFVIVLGLENILIIVKAVMSTPEEFEVKQRIAAGLSKEGRAISRNLSTLLLMLSLGMVFFHYAMKEFCIIGLVALLCDAFLQLFFFPTVLSIDLRRLELSDLGPDPVSVAMQQVDDGTPSTRPSQGPCPTSLHIPPPSRWRSKRVKFAYFLASARLVSRAIMVAVVVSMMVLWAAKTERFQKLLGFNFVLPPPTPLPLDPPSSPMDTLSQHKEAGPPSKGFLENGAENLNDDEPSSRGASQWDKVSSDISELVKMGVRVQRGDGDGWRVTCDTGEVCWRAMVTTHWPKLLEHYGRPTQSRFLTVLPPITLTFDLGTNPVQSSQSHTHSRNHSYLYRIGLFLLSHPYFTKGSVACAFVCVIVGYCVWLFRSTLRRLDSSLSEGVGGGNVGRGSDHLRSSSLKGHTQDIECLCVSDGHLVSASLDGDIRVWNTDTMTRGCNLTISRSEKCGDLSTYAGKWRPDAEGCEASTDNKSLLGFQMVPVTLPSSPTSTNSYPGGAPNIGSPPLTCSTTVRMTSPSVQMMSSTTNQVAATLTGTIPAASPPLSPPTSPPPSPSVTPHHKYRRHSTHSLQEQVLRTQLEGRNTSPNVSLPSPAAVSIPLCGLPTSPPHSVNKPRPQSANVRVPSSHSRPTSVAVGHSNQPTKPVQTAPQYSLSRHNSSTQLSHVTRRGHSRSKSSGAFPARTHVPPTAGAEQLIRGCNLSTSDLKDTPELSRSSVSLSSTFIFDSHPSKAPPPNPQKGYDFSKHFSLFSPFTSNMALEYCQGQRSSEIQECPPPPVWCMDVWNGSIAIGCGNGQIEVWNMSNGSLVFALSTNLSGATVISITPQGIVSGHMDGCLYFVGLDGRRRQTLVAHSRPVSVLRSSGERVVSGGYDGMVVVHRLSDLEREAAVTIHNGNNVTSLALDTTVAMCVSGCGGGVVCCWELSTGNCRHMLQEGYGAGILSEGVSVVKLEISVGGAIVGLMSDETIVVWDKTTGESLYTVTLDGLCQDYVILGDRYIAACVESSIAVYDIECGQKRFEIAVEGSERNVILVRHLLSLQGTHVVCSTGREIQIIPCNVKLKMD